MFISCVVCYLYSILCLSCLCDLGQAQQILLVISTDTMNDEPASRVSDCINQPSMDHPLLYGHILKFPYDGTFFTFLQKEFIVPRNLQFIPRTMVFGRDMRNDRDYMYRMILSESEDLQDLLYYLGDPVNHDPCSSFRSERSPLLSFHTILAAAARTDPSGDYLRAFEECHLLMDLWSDDRGTAMFRRVTDYQFAGVDVAFRSGVFDCQYYPTRVPGDGSLCYGYPCPRWFHGDDLPPAPMIPYWIRTESENPGSPRQHAKSLLLSIRREDNKKRRQSTIRVLQDVYEVYPKWEQNAFVRALDLLRHYHI